MDPYCRLRVPRYLKIYEMLFFAVFLGLYYAVLIDRRMDHVTVEEVVLFFWLLAFAYDEFGQFYDAGMTFYATDFWSIWDFGIVAIGVTFFILRIVGLAKHDHKVIDTAFDILALEALLLVPRICSLLSLVPFFGVLIPCLKEMANFSTQFLALVLIIYAGFLTTFTLLARDAFSPATVSLMLLKIFFGSSYIGFDNANAISPLLGLPLMLVFIWLTNILLITCLISLISNKMTEIMNNAAEEYNYLYSVYVLEASTSNRLTYYFPPLNLISLVFRPLRLFVSADRLRSMRIVFLKITHAPHVAVILAFERISAAATQNHKPWAGMLSGPKSSVSLSKRERAREAMRSSMIKSRSVRDKSRPRARFSTVETNGDHPSPLHSAMVKRKQSHRAQAYSKLSGKENNQASNSDSDREHSEEDGKTYYGANDMKEKDRMIAQLVAQVVRLTEKVEGLVEIVAKQQQIVLRDDNSAHEEEARDVEDDADVDE